MTALRPLAAAAAVAAIALLAGCAQPIPQPSADPPQPVPPPVVGVAQQERILQDLATKMAAADKALSVGPAAPRLAEPASLMREAEYKQAAKKVKDVVVPLGFDEKSSVVATSDTWPRDYFVVTNPPKGSQSFRLYVLTEASPQANYQLWGWVRPFGGVQLPVTVSPEVGSPPIGPDDSSLKVSPKDTVTQYVDVLNKGSKSKYAASFAKTDELRDGYAADLKTWSSAVKTVKGTASWEHKAGKWGVHALQTGDGGALVVGAEVSSLTVAIKEGSMTVGADVAAFAGKSKFTKSVTMQYTTTVMFWVPGASSKEAIEVLGAEKVMTAASGK